MNSRTPQGCVAGGRFSQKLPAAKSPDAEPILESRLADSVRIFCAEFNQWQSGGCSAVDLEDNRNVADCFIQLAILRRIEWN